VSVKLLASDLDGTFLGPDGLVSPGNLRALQIAREAGLEVMFVTGRPPRWLPGVIRQTGFEGHIISANGGIIVDARSREVIRTFPMRTEDAAYAIDRMLDVVPGLEFGVERSEVGMRLAEASSSAEPTIHEEHSPNGEFVMTRGYRPSGPSGADIPVGPIHELIEGDRAVKIVARPPLSDGRNADELLALIDSVIGGRIQATHSNLHDVLIEFSAAGVTKGSTLALLAGERGFHADEVAAVGDMPNDAPMLEWAGWPYVVANAHASLLAQFARVLPRNDEDAVGQLLIELAGSL